MSAAGAISTLVWALIVIIIIVVVVVVLFKVINLLFIAPIVLATPAAYTETVGLVSLLSVGLSQSLNLSILPNFIFLF
jgi:hypothetical protein